MDSTDSILVLGAGELGLSVLRALAASPPAGTTLSVLLRPTTLSSRPYDAELKHLGISIVNADVGALSATAIADIFAAGCYTAILSCVGFAAGAGTQRKITEAVLLAAAAQRRRIRFIPWQFGVDYDVIGVGSPQPLFDEQLQVRALLRAQPDELVQWRVVSTGIFTSFLFEPAFGVVELGAEDENPTCRALGGWETEITVTTPEDIGMLTARVVSDTAVWATGSPNVVFTAGETLSYGRLAQIVESVTGRRAEKEVWTAEALERELAADPEDTMRKYRAVFALGNGVAWPIEDTYNFGHGIRLVGVEEWLLEHQSKRRP
ncbi:NmrA domain-containing protein [Mycena kentingensis (nom. inval.)]|nr:NmrA domain-containing protein [Mycena kentingensis (nom. inval.)]